MIQTKLIMTGVVALIVVGLSAACSVLYDKNQTLKQTITRLEVSIQLKDDLIKSQNRAIETSQNAIAKWGETNEEIRRKSDALIAELATLRATENQRSLLQPYETGNDADDRRRAILLRFTGNREGDRAASQDPGGPTSGTGSP